MEYFPLEIVCHILLLCSYKDILSFCKTNKKYHKILTSEYFWSKKSKYDFGCDAVIFFNNQSPIKAYLELLLQYYYFDGSENFIDDDKCFTLAIRNGRLDAIEKLSLGETYGKDIDIKLHLCDRIFNIEAMCHLIPMIKDNNKYQIKKHLIDGLRGDENIIMKFLDKSDNISHTGEMNSCIYNLAYGLSMNGNVNLFKYIYEKFPDVFDGGDEEILFGAGSKNSIEIINYLLIDRNYINDEDSLFYLLYGAIKGNHFGLIDRILKLGLNLKNFCPIGDSLPDSSFEYLLDLYMINLDENKFIYSYVKNCARFDLIKLYLDRCKKYSESKSFLISEILDICDNCKLSKSIIIPVKKNNKKGEHTCCNNKLLYNKLINKSLSKAIEDGNTYFIKYLIYMGGDINKSLEMIHYLKYRRVKCNIILTLLNNGADKNLLFTSLARGNDLANLNYLVKLSPPDQSTIYDLLKYQYQYLMQPTIQLLQSILYS